MSLARGDDFIHVAEGHGGDDRPEDFFLHDFHLVVGVDEDGGLDEIALVAVARAAGGGLRAFLHAGFEIAANAIELLFGNERADDRYWDRVREPTRIFAAAWEMPSTTLSKIFFST